ncbi:unnamed protein product, partial [Closterium sp. Naga37s-1]
MAGAAERRVLIVGGGGSPAGPAMEERAGGGRQHVLHLAHQKTGASLAGTRWRVGSRGAMARAAACYMQQGGAVLEVAWFKDALSSWLLKDSVLQDGSLFMATPIDAAFLLLPILDKSRMKKEGSGSEGMFRSLDEICTVDGFPSYGWLQSQGVWDPVLPLITDIREVGSTRFYRLNDSRVLAWLTCKVAALKAALRQHGEAPVRGLPDTDLEAYAVGLLSEYLPASFHAALCRHLSISEGELKQSHQGGQRLASPPATTATQPKPSLPLAGANSPLRPSHVGAAAAGAAHTFSPPLSARHSAPHHARHSAPHHARHPPPPSNLPQLSCASSSVSSSLPRSALSSPASSALHLPAIPSLQSLPSLRSLSSFSSAHTCAGCSCAGCAGGSAAGGTRSPSDGGEVRWYFSKGHLVKGAVAAAVPQAMVASSAGFLRFSARDSHALETAFRQREEELLTLWWKEYADAAVGPAPGGLLPLVAPLLSSDRIRPWQIAAPLRSKRRRRGGWGRGREREEERQEREREMEREREREREREMARERMREWRRQEARRHEGGLEKGEGLWTDVREEGAEGEGGREAEEAERKSSERGVWDSDNSGDAGRQGDGEGEGDGEESEGESEEGEEEPMGVTVKGGLYEVDLGRRRSYAVYWEGEDRRVLRGLWFGKGKAQLTWQPLREDVAEQLEEAYRKRVWRRRWFQPSGLFASRVPIAGAGEGVSAVFTGDDSSWRAQLWVEGARLFSSPLHAMAVRRGFPPPPPIPAAHEDEQQVKEEELDDYCSM